MAWQPIETAPKDGTTVLLAWPSGMVTAGYRSRYENVGWATPHGTYSGVYQPTHWQPLPPAPDAL